METMPTMTAAQYVSTVSHPVVRFASTGTPAGEDVAVLDETVFGFDLDEVTGTVTGGRWTWDGAGDVRDAQRNAQRNTVTAIWVRDDIDNYLAQRQEWESAV